MYQPSNHSFLCAYSTLVQSRESIRPNAMLPEGYLASRSEPKVLLIGRIIRCCATASISSNGSSVSHTTSGSNTYPCQPSHWILLGICRCRWTFNTTVTHRSRRGDRPFIEPRSQQC